MFSTKQVFVTEFIILCRLLDSGIIDGNSVETTPGSKTQSNIDIIMLEDYRCVATLFKCRATMSARARIIPVGPYSDWL